MHPKISIITVVYNNEKMILDAVKSVLSQDYKNIEYIVIDGNSTDKTASKIRAFESQIDTFISEVDQGMYDALNKGIKKATGDIVGVLHADDLFAHKSVIKDVAAVFSKKNIDSVYGDLIYVDRNDTEEIVRKWKSGVYKRRKFLAGWMPPHPAFFVKRSCFSDYGFYGLNFKSAADYELMLRFLYKCSISSYHLPEVLVKMRLGGKSNESLYNRFVAHQQDRKAWKENNIKPRFYTLFLKPIRKIPQFF